MKKEIIFLDIDGTILDAPRGLEGISDKTEYAINELVNKGHFVFITSGRCRCLLPENVKKLKGVNFITTNGAFAYLSDGTVLFEKPMNFEVIKEINEYALSHDYVYVDEGQDVMLVSDLNHEIFKDFCLNWKISESLFSEYEEGHKLFMMMCAFRKDEEREEFKRHFKDKINVTNQYGYMSVDINDLGINKSIGINGVLKALNLKAEDAYAFGDGLNDIEMLELCGNSYVMSNAIDEVKKHGKNIAPDVLEDGFYQIMVEKGLIEPID